MLKQEAINQLLSLSYVLTEINDVDYPRLLSTLNGGSVGKHVRHVAEFYDCLLSNRVNNMVNYDARKRNVLLEENVKYAQDYILELIDNLHMIDKNSSVVLVSKYNGLEVLIESSLYREVVYNIEHTVHHLAMISIAIRTNFKYIQLPENFGVANSTIQYLKTQKLK